MTTIMITATHMTMRTILDTAMDTNMATITALR